MVLNEFREAGIKGRKKLLNKILGVFKQLKPVAIHQFGSGVSGYKDEFSDLDIWITFPKNKISAVVENQSKIFKSISPVLLKHHSKSWSPQGGSAVQIIHETPFGLFQADYYISKDLKAVIKPNKNIKEPHTLKKDINLLLCLIFISVKGIIRKWEGDDFKKNVKHVYKRILEKYGVKIKRRNVRLSFKFIDNLLTDLYPLANKGQKTAIFKIGNYAKQVENIYTGIES